MHTPLRQEPAPLLRTLGWAFYLACSWTWVIGMYLPVILVRDFGLAGWLAFAIPNVIGAAAMGWIISSRQRAMDIIEFHFTAVSIFTAVTIGFQIYALLWLMPLLVGMWGGLFVAAALMCALFLRAAENLATRLNGAAVWFFSMAIFIMLGLSGVLEMPAMTGGQPARGLIGLIPACMLGFLLCPYLDISFLASRVQMEGAEARRAFTLGFGVLFLAMIFFALLYALPLLNQSIRGTLAWLVAGHFALQVAFTIAAHTRVSRTLPANVLAILLAGILGGAALLGQIRGYEPFGITLGEVFYRGFMGFYGLIFPAYVLIVMLAGGTLRLYWIAVAVAMPFFAVGFIGGSMPWTAVGVSFVLIAGGIARVGRLGALEVSHASAASQDRP